MYAIKHEFMRFVKLDQMCRIEALVYDPKRATTFGTIRAAQHVRDWLQSTKAVSPGSLSLAEVQEAQPS